MERKEEERLWKLYEDATSEASESEDSASGEESTFEPNEVDESSSCSSDESTHLDILDHEPSVLEDDEWYEDTAAIPDFAFDDFRSGIKLEFENAPSVPECFDKLWDNDIMKMILESTNGYRTNLDNIGRPHKKYSRSASIRYISIEELRVF